MSIFYVDFENVHDAGLEGIKDLTKKDKIILFYNKEQKISIDGMLEISSCKAEIEYRKTLVSGRNYLDFQLGTYLGYGMNQYKNEHIVIVSKDNGFDSIVHFWKQEGVDIQRRKSIALELKADEVKSDFEPDVSIVVETTEEPIENVTEEVKDKAVTKKSTGRKKKATPAPEVKEEIQKDTSLPERYRKKMRPILEKQGLSSLQYSKVYKAMITITKTKPFRKQLISDFGEELGSNIYEYSQHVFSEYWKSKLETQ